MSDVMKTILIERVANGWLVRPFSSCENWAYGGRSEMYIYKTMEELQAGLPELVKIASNPVPPAD
jgi:hypothetical protein